MLKRQNVVRTTDVIGATLSLQIFTTEKDWERLRRQGGICELERNVNKGRNNKNKRKE